MRPFEGITVLDLTHVLAGSFSTYQLAVLGADVIKIEAPDNPDMTRIETSVPGLDEALNGTYFQAQNAGKRAITLDLKTDKGRGVMTRLIEALGEVERAQEVLHIERSEIAQSCANDTNIIAGHMLSRTADEWETILNEARVPAARVRSLDETLAHPQIASRQVLQANEATIGAEGGMGSPANLPVAAFSYEHGSPSLDRPPPRLGEHTVEVLDELGYSSDEITNMKEAKAI